MTVTITDNDGEAFVELSFLWPLMIATSEQPSLIYKLAVDSEKMCVCVCVCVGGEWNELWWIV